MKLQSISIMRWNSDTEEPVVLDAAYNLAEYSCVARNGAARRFVTLRALTPRLCAHVLLR